MPIPADDLQTLHDYAQGVMARAAHHAENVRAVVLALLGGVVWRAKPGSVSVRQQGGGLGNVLWWESLNEKKYACAYNHETREIEIRDRTLQGGVLHRFTNSTSVIDVERIFAEL